MAKKTKRMCECPKEPLERARSIFRLARSCEEKKSAANYVEMKLEEKANAIALTSKGPTRADYEAAKAAGRKLPGRGHESAVERFSRTVARPEMSRMTVAIERSCGVRPNPRFATARSGLFGMR